MNNDEEYKRWRQDVMEAMEERIRKRESEVGYFNRVRSRESRICHACGKRGHIRKDCGVARKDENIEKGIFNVLSLTREDLIRFV